MRVRRLWVLVLQVLSSAALLAQSSPTADPKRQLQEQTFRAGVELIQLDVTAVDGQRKPVRGLTASDFTVLEDGKPRPIRAFSAVDLPARDRTSEAVWSNDAPPDVATNQISQKDGRLVIILMDRSIPYEGGPYGGSVRAQNIAAAAVETLGPNDLGALVSTSGGVPQNLTSDRARLIKAIYQRDWSTESYYFPWTIDGGDDPRCLCGLCVLETIRRISDAVRDTPRWRKVLLFIGRGLMLQQAGPQAMSADPGCVTHLKDARNAVFDSLKLSNLTVHSIDPRGLFSVGPQTNVRVHGAQGGPDTKGPRDRLAMQQTDTIDALRTQLSLDVLPKATGGRTVVNTNDPAGQTPAILGESEAYYLIGFEPSAPGERAVRRSIEVKTARKGVQVFAQRQYLVPTAQGQAATTTGRSIAAALTGLLPVSETPLAVATAAFANPTGEKASARISVDVGAFARGEATNLALELRVAVVNPTGEQVGSAQQASTVAIPRATADRAAIAIIPTHVELPPGDYEIRVAVADAARGHVASAFASLTIPEFDTLPLSLSHVAIEVAPGSPASAEPSAARDLTPTTQRTFDRTDHVTAFFQIYQGTARGDQLLPVGVRVRVVDAAGREVRDQSIVFRDTEFVNRRIDCRINVPIDRLPAGEYMLRIDATKEKGTAGRALRFRVR